MPKIQLEVNVAYISWIPHTDLTSLYIHMMSSGSLNTIHWILQFLIIRKKCHAPILNLYKIKLIKNLNINNSFFWSGTKIQELKMYVSIKNLAKSGYNIDNNILKIFSRYFYYNLLLHCALFKYLYLPNV